MKLSERFRKVLSPHLFFFASSLGTCPYSRPNSKTRQHQCVLEHTTSSSPHPGISRRRPCVLKHDEMPGCGGVITPGSGIHKASIGCEYPYYSRLNKYCEYCGGTLKLEARLHLLSTTGTVVKRYPSKSFLPLELALLRNDKN